MAATWPPAQTRRHGPWTIRDGAGGGQRVAACTADGRWTDADIPLAEAAMRALAQPPLFLIRATDSALDAALAARGYLLHDPVIAYAAPAAALPAPPWMTTFPHWPPLAIATDLWAAGGITAPRIAVMHRAPAPKTAIIARTGDRATGVAFAALHGPIAMLHALEVAPGARRQGSAQNLLAACAQWTRAMGGHTISLVVTEANTPARALYAKCGLQTAGSYHYRIQSPAHD